MLVNKPRELQPFCFPQRRMTLQGQIGMCLGSRRDVMLISMRWENLPSAAEAQHDRTWETAQFCVSGV